MKVHVKCQEQHLIRNITEHIKIWTLGEENQPRHSDVMRRREKSDMKNDCIKVVNKSGKWGKKRHQPLLLIPCIHNAA